MDSDKGYLIKLSQFSAESFEIQILLSILDKILTFCQTENLGSLLENGTLFSRCLVAKMGFTNFKFSLKYGKTLEKFLSYIK